MYSKFTIYIPHKRKNTQNIQKKEIPIQNTIIQKKRNIYKIKIIKLNISKLFI